MVFVMRASVYLRAALVVLLAQTSLAAVHELKINGDRISLQANRAPLRDILADFVKAGIRVKVDPDLEARVSGSVVDMEISEALEDLLAPYGYALIWSVVPGPLGDIECLEEIQVFRRDNPRRIEPFMPETHFRVVRGPLSDSPEIVADELLLTVKPGTDIRAFKVLLAQIGGSVIGSVPELGIYRIRLPANSNVWALLETLRANDMISRAEPNYAYRLPDHHPVSIMEQGGTHAAAVRAAPGVPAVAVLDSGLRSLSTLEGLVAGTYDAIDPERSLDDRAGHGTQMALVASGVVAPAGSAASGDGVPVLAIRAFDENGVTSSFAMMRAINHAAGQGARVINLSWGTSTPSEFIEAAIRQAQGHGMVVVASAGNEPTGRPMYPAAYAGVIGVAAVQADGSPWPSSNHGDAVTLAAPGSADFPVGYQGPPGGYAGTSIASAYVARNAALYLGGHPRAGVNEVRQAMINASTPPASPENLRYGSGSLDPAAVERLLQQP